MGLKHLSNAATVSDIDKDIEYEMSQLRALVGIERAAAARAWKKGNREKWRHHHAVARAYQRGITALQFIGFPF